MRAAVVAAELAQRPVDLRRVREGQWRVIVASPFKRSIWRSIVIRLVAAA